MAQPCAGRWLPGNPVFNGAVNDIAEWNGGLAAVGNFTQVGGQPCAGIAVWDGESWAPYGPTTPTGNRRSVVEYNGLLVMDGMAVSSPWWVPMGAGLTFTTFTSMVVHNGELYASGGYDSSLGSCVFKLTQATSPWRWLAVGNLGWNGTNSAARDLQVYNGKLVAVGTFPAPTQGQTPNIAEWNGTSWSSMGTVAFPNPPQYLGVAEGQLFVSGSSFSGYLLSYDGSTWRTELQNLSSPAVAVAEYDGAVHVGVGGRFMIRRGGVWGPSPVYLTSSGLPTMYDLVVHDGALFVGGSFNGVAGAPAWNLSRYDVPGADFNGDGDLGTDADIEAFFACLSGNCCGTCYAEGADFNADGDIGTDQDIESFFRVLAGGAC